MLKRLRHFSVCAILCIASCVTVNVYFPAAAIQKAADKIVDDITNTKKEQKPESKPDITGMFLDKLMKINPGPKEVYAQTDINITTPAIRNIKQSMREIFPQLRPFFVRGSVGENNNGFVEIRDTSDLNLKEKADVTRFVDQLNKSRRELYLEIVKANKLDDNSVIQVQKIFANSWRNKSRTNWWIQNDNGEWERKQ